MMRFLGAVSLAFLDFASAQPVLFRALPLDKQRNYNGVCPDKLVEVTFDQGSQKLVKDAQCLIAEKMQVAPKDVMIFAHKGYWNELTRENADLQLSCFANGQSLTDAKWMYALAETAQTTSQATAAAAEVEKKALKTNGYQNNLSLPTKQQTDSEDRSEKLFNGLGEFSVGLSNGNYIQGATLWKVLNLNLSESSDLKFLRHWRAPKNDHLKSIIFYLARQGLHKELSQLQNLTSPKDFAAWAHERDDENRIPLMALARGGGITEETDKTSGESESNGLASLKILLQACEDMGVDVRDLISPRPEWTDQNKQTVLQYFLHGSLPKDAKLYFVSWLLKNLNRTYKWGVEELVSAIREEAGREFFTERAEHRLDEWMGLIEEAAAVANLKQHTFMGA